MSKITGSFILQVPNIVFDGDSLTYGEGTVPPGQFPSGSDYPSQVVSELDPRGTYYNVGVGGETIATMLANAPTNSIALPIPATWSSAATFTSDAAVTPAAADIINGPALTLLSSNNAVTPRYTQNIQLKRDGQTPLTRALILSTCWDYISAVQPKGKINVFYYSATP